MAVLKCLSMVELRYLPAQCEHFADTIKNVCLIRINADVFRLHRIYKNGKCTTLLAGLRTNTVYSIFEFFIYFPVHAI